MLKLSTQIAILKTLACYFYKTKS